MPTEIVNSDLITLSDACLAISKKTRRATTYRRVWEAVTTGAVLAVKVDGMWRVNRNDLPEIVRILRVSPSQRNVVVDAAA